MPHPIYGPPSHRLTTVHFVLTLPTKENGRHSRLEAHGRSSTSRAALWSVSETWTQSEQDAGLQPTDALHHLGLVAMQDQPITQRQLELGLTGQGWEQLELPL